MKDALDNEIVLGNTYGYSSENNGLIKIVIGIANSITSKGLISLTIISKKTFNNDYIRIGDEGKTAVKSYKLFPITLNK